MAATVLLLLPISYWILTISFFQMRNQTFQMNSLYFKPLHCPPSHISTEEISVEPPRISSCWLWMEFFAALKTWPNQTWFQQWFHKKHLWQEGPDSRTCEEPQAQRYGRHSEGTPHKSSKQEIQAHSGESHLDRVWENVLIWKCPECHERQTLVKVTSRLVVNWGFMSSRVECQFLQGMMAVR